MNRSHISRFVLLTVALVLVLASAVIFPTGRPTQAQGKPLNVIATTTIIQDVAQNVAGDKFSVNFLVPTDGDVHAFEPKPDDVKKIANADLILVNGVGLEQFIDKLIADSGTKGKVVVVSQGLQPGDRIAAVSGNQVRLSRRSWRVEVVRPLDYGSFHRNKRDQKLDQGWSENRAA